MFPAHRKIVIVAGLVVVVVVAGCARSTSSGVRRIELVPADRAETSTSHVAAMPEGGEAMAAQADAVAGEAERSEAAESPGAVASGAALSSLTEWADRGDAPPSTDSAPVPDDVEGNADERFIALVGAALSASDLCALWDTLSLVPLDARVPAALAQQMRLVTEIMELSNGIVPGSLRDEWTVATEGFDEVAGLLADGRSDQAIAAYDDPAFAGAQGDIADWMTRRCG